MAKFGIGQAVKRVEDQRFLTGKGRYVDDINLPNQAYAVAVASPYANARVKSIDTSKAAAAPGVLLVLTGADAIADKVGELTAHPMPEEVGAPAGFRTWLPLICHDQVRYVGDRVAFVVAETQMQARDAADLVEVEYEELPAVADLEDAVKEGAPKVWEKNDKGNWAFGLMFGDQAATDAAFAKAKHHVKLRVEHNRLAPNAMEPRVAIGNYDEADDQYTLYACTQNPHGVRMELSHVFHCAESQIRVVSPDVGGGFGLKGGPFPDDCVTLWASKKLGRPVKWLATRTESILTDRHGREMVMYGEMALDENGKILGLRAKALYQVGAYFVGPGLVPAAFAVRFIPEAYDIQALHVMVQGLFTNTSPVGPYRGAGRPEAAYFTERMIEHAARQIGIPSDEIRRRNLIPESKLPYTTPTFWVYDSGEFHRVMEKCLSVSDWKGFEARKKKSESEGKLRGRAVTFYIEQGGIFNDRMDLRFDPSGSVSIIAGTHSHGQGHATVFAQLVHEWLGVPFETIRYIQGDTDKVPIGRGTYAARSSLVGGNALKIASAAIIDKAKPMAAALMEAAEGDLEFKDGSFRVVGTDKVIPLTEVAKAFYAPMGPLTEKLGVGLEAQGTYSTNPPNHPNGSHVAEVEIDPETGEVRVDRYFVVDDLGVVLNPMIVRGQIHGGVAQGVGQALVEHAIYDKGSAQMLSATFMDYGMPRAELFPEIETHLEEVPSKTNPLGVKGIGESGTIGAPPTVINAILDALKPYGVDKIDMPATPARVWDAMQAARKNSGGASARA
jgi:carbon-monoxide dehydrogenase large subunit